MTGECKDLLEALLLKVPGKVLLCLFLATTILSAHA